MLITFVQLLVCPLRESICLTSVMSKFKRVSVNLTKPSNLPSFNVT